MSVFETHLSGLWERGGKLWLKRPERSEAIAVTVRYLRPITGRVEIVFVDDKDREVVSIASIDAVSADARPLVEAALRERYLLAVIQRVDDLAIHMGTRFWRVETDRGQRAFALREPGKNIIWLSDARLMLRDTAGNRYEIPDLNALDRRSQRLVDRFT